MDPILGLQYCSIDASLLQALAELLTFSNQWVSARINPIRRSEIRVTRAKLGRSVAIEYTENFKKFNGYCGVMGFGRLNLRVAVRFEDSAVE